MKAIVRRLACLAILVCIFQWGTQTSANTRCIEWDQDTGICKKWVAASIIAKLDIDGISGAEVRLDTPDKIKIKPLCTLPCRGWYPIPSDPVLLVISKRGYQDLHVVVGSAERWRTPDLSSRLLLCPNIQFEGMKEGTNVSVNGRHVGVWPESFSGTNPAKVIATELGQAPEEGCELRSQLYIFEFSHEKYSTWSSPLISVQAGPLPTIVTWAPEPKKGTILVLSALGDATVLLDGDFAGTLPAAGGADVAFEIHDVPVGVHTLILRLPDESLLSHDQVWGDFPSEQPNVLVDEKRTTVARFLLPTQRTPDENPVDFNANWAQLEEECESHQRACLSLGWARRWGVGGPANDVAADKAFDLACHNTDGDAQARIQGCAAHRWMVDMGLVQGQRGGHYECVQRDKWLADPVTPCVRSHLSRESQSQVDPTLYVDHNMQNVNIGLPLFILAGVGPMMRFARGGLGLSTNVGVLIMDVDFTVGWASFWRWDAAYSKQSWQDVGTVGLEIGPAWSFADHFYGLVHFAWDSTLHQNSSEPYLLGGRVAAGWTESRTTRRKLFVDVGMMFQWAPADVLGPTPTDLVNTLLASGDLAKFRVNWQRQQNTSVQFVYAPTLSVGWNFEL